MDRMEVEGVTGLYTPWKTSRYATRVPRGSTMSSGKFISTELHGASTGFHGNKKLGPRGAFPSPLGAPLKSPWITVKTNSTVFSKIHIYRGFFHGV